MILFGLSKNLWMAVLARFLTGAINAAVPAAKTAVSEVHLGLDPETDTRDSAILIVTS
jgi:hypothetical protein